MPREVILGLHGFSADSDRQMHDAGVCLLVDGEVVADRGLALFRRLWAG